MAKTWDKQKITTDSNETVEAQAPVIISASRATDIPAFYADWFMHRLKIGYIKWTNPFNNAPLHVSFRNARVFVFWSKNPKPMLKHLDYLKEQNLNYYFQYTLNDYDKTIEKNVPPLQSRIETFIELSEKIGKEKVVWRFDPLLLTKEIGTEELLRKIENIGNQLKNHTQKFGFSFADISAYRKVQTNMDKAQIPYIEFDTPSMETLAAGIQQLNKAWNFDVGTCSEKIDLEKFGITHNKCVDDDLMIKLFAKDKILMDFLGYKPPTLQTSLFSQNIDNEPDKPNLKDKGQRELCGCIMSKDIGQYNTCPHLCEYCYANTSKETAMQNFKLHSQNMVSETILIE